MNELERLFMAAADFDAKKLKRCRTCTHRLRFELNPYSKKDVQCCELKPSKRSNSGYVTVKVTDVACRYYKEQKEN